MAQNRYFCKIFACSYPPLLWGQAKGEKKASDTSDWFRAHALMA